MRIMVRLLLFVIFTIATAFSQVTYYFSSSEGNDAGNGLTQETAFKSLAKLQSLLPSAKPGDQFLLKRGDIWTTRSGTSTVYAGIVGLDLSSCIGTSHKYITIGDYGSGSLPTFNFSGTGASFQLEGAKYVLIKNIRLTSSGGSGNIPFTGISADGSIHGGFKGIIIDGLTIDGLEEGIFLNSHGSSDSITIKNCEIKNSIGQGESNGIFSSISHTYIYNNLIHNNGTSTTESQIYLNGVINGEIVGNTLYGGLEGLHIANNQNLLISQNEIFNCSFASMEIYDRNDGYIAIPIDNVRISRNKLHDTHRGVIFNKDSSGDGKGTTNVTVDNNSIYNMDVVATRVENIGSFTHSNFYNNTIVNCLEGIKLSSGISISEINVKNNILYNTTYSSGSLLTITNSSDVNNIVLDYNLYYKTVGNDTKVGGASRTLSEFKIKYLSDEQHSISSNPLFVNASNYDFSLQSGSPAIGSGINLGLRDILGNLISGNPDIGAVQYKTNLNQISGLKIFLEGSYENGIMSTELYGQKIIPLTQPYVGAPWSYSGSEKVTSIPQNIVDWVLVELRTNLDVSSRIARLAAFINSNGDIVDLSGNKNFSFANVPDGDYYIVVVQRNHLAVMSAKPVNLKNGVVSYDFTTGEDKAYGSNAMANLGDGVFGMYGGDADSNGIIDDSDVNDVGSNLFKTNYLLPDLDLNSKVNVIDYKLPKTNLGKKTFVTGIFAL